jgi:hypothetical protein
MRHQRSWPGLRLTRSHQVRLLPADSAGIHRVDLAAARDRAGGVYRRIVRRCGAQLAANRLVVNRAPPGNLTIGPRAPLLILAVSAQRGAIADVQASTSVLIRGDRYGIRILLCGRAYLCRSGLTSMQPEVLADPLGRGPALDRRAVALANVRWFRAMAWRALRDGRAQGELRAFNARTAARIVLRQAKRDALVSSLMTNALAAGR